MKKPPYGFCTHLLFASATMLIFGGIFLHRIYSLIKVNIKWTSMKTADFARQKCITRRKNPNSRKSSWKTRQNTPKGQTKIRPFVFCRISKDWIFHTIYQILEYPEQVGFEYDVPTVIVDNYSNAKICSE